MKEIFRIELSKVKNDELYRLNRRNYPETSSEMREMPFGPYQYFSWRYTVDYDKFIQLQQDHFYEDACWGNVFDAYPFGNEDPPKYLRSGCRTKDSLIRWFENSLDVLDRHGFIISRYRVDGRVEYDSKTDQVRFSRYDCLLIESTPIM